MSFAASGSPTGMRKLTYAMNVSVDGYISGTPVPGDELHQWFNDQLRETEMSLYGRTMWELMSGYWPTADEQPDASPVEIDFARVWRETPKVVFSSTLSSVDWNARLHTGDAVTEIRRLKAEDGGEMEIGGARLAGAAMRAGLIDEYLLITHPVLLGGGAPFFSALDAKVDLRLVETLPFPDGVLVSRYATRA
jgi:dihydrofolate reductase